MDFIDTYRDFDKKIKANYLREQARKDPENNLDIFWRISNTLLLLYGNAESLLNRKHYCLMESNISQDAEFNRDVLQIRILLDKFNYSIAIENYDEVLYVIDTIKLNYNRLYNAIHNFRMENKNDSKDEQNLAYMEEQFEIVSEDMNVLNEILKKIGIDYKIEIIDQDSKEYSTLTESIKRRKPK